MTSQPASLDIIASAPPMCAEEAVDEVLEGSYGLRGALTPLVSERDQNFRLDTPGGRRFVVKIANAEEPLQITDFQVQALLHLEKTGCAVPVPQVLATGTGEVITSLQCGGRRHHLRVVSYLPGSPLEGRSPDPDIAFDIGRCLGLLDIALRDFSHAGESQVLLWDMQRAAELRPLVRHVPDPDLQHLVGACIAAFEERLAPALANLRVQVVHNDLNPGNVLLTGAASPVVAGVIDFGDMLRAPLVADVAIAASYLRATDDDLGTLAALTAGFESELPLQDEERRLLYDLVRTRLAATITILYWRAAARSPDDPYLKKALEERSAERFLQYLSRLGREHFQARVFPDKS